MIFRHFNSFIIGLDAESDLCLAIGGLKGFTSVNLTFIRVQIRFFLEHLYAKQISEICFLIFTIRSNMTVL